MKPPGTSPDEQERLTTLRSYEVLDTPPEAAFDSLTELAARICHAPIALIALVDEHRLWIKSVFGSFPQEIPRTISFCTHAILQEGMLLVPDATLDPRFADNPLVKGEPYLRFYAGCPLVTADGAALGTLCVLDLEPRQLDPDHERALRLLSRQVMEALELHLHKVELSATRRQLDAEAALRESGDHFRQLAEQSDQVFWIADPASKQALYVNDAFERIWGRPAEEILADSHAWLAAIHPEDRARVLASLPLQAEGRFREEYRIVRPDGEVRWIAERAFPVRDHSGAMHRIVGVAEDITERVRNQQAVLKERSLADQTINSLPGVFYVFDQDGRFLRWNKNFERITGYPAEELQALHPLDLFRGADRDLVARRIEEVFASGRSHAEAALVARDGRATPYYFSGRRIELDGRPCLVGMGVNISALKQAEAERDRLFDLSPDLFCVAGFDGYFKQLNPAWERVLGYSRAELLTTPYVEFVHPDDRPQTRAEAERVVDAEPLSLEFENRYRCRDGSYRWLSWHSVTVPEQQLVFAVARDVTTQLEVSHALQVSEERYRSVVESARDGIFTVAPDGRITSLNLAFEATTGWCRTEWVGKTSRDILHPEDVAKAKQYFASVLQGEVVPTFELRVAAKDVGYIPMELTVTSQRLGDQVVGVLGIARDLRDRRRMEEQLRQVEKLESIGRLAAGIAHDFNNLLTVQQGHISLLLESQGLPAHLARHLREIAAAAERAAELTRQLLLFSRKRSMRRHRMDLNEAVIAVAKMLDRIVGKDITLQLHCDGHLPPIDADPNMMEQVLMNLVINARDAMSGGGQIEISTQSVTLDEAAVRSRPPARPGRFVCLTVADTGSGIAPEIIDNIFEPFFTTKDVGEGTGLGLATVHGIVQQHEGWIEVESRLDAGTKFRAYLPASAAAGESPTAEARPASTRGGTETILAVEDEEALRSLVKTVLERSGYRVWLAGDGQEALALWRERGASVDLLLTDMVMPHGLSGQELAAQLLAERPDLKVLVMSGYTPQRPGRPSTDEAARRQFAFLQKPYRPGELITAVRRCLDGKTGALPDPVQPPEG